MTDSGKERAVDTITSALSLEQLQLNMSNLLRPPPTLSPTIVLGFLTEEISLRVGEVSTL